MKRSIYGLWVTEPWDEGTLSKEMYNSRAKAIEASIKWEKESIEDDTWIEGTTFYVEEFLLEDDKS